MIWAKQIFVGFAFVIPIVWAGIVCASPDAVDQSSTPEIVKAYAHKSADFREFFRKHEEYWREYAIPPTEDSTSQLSTQPAYGAWQNFVNQQQSAWQEFKAQQEQSWQNYVTQQRAAWEEYVRSVEAVWGEFVGSTQDTWVEYSGARDARSLVDFRAGYAVFEITADSQQADWEQQAKQALRDFVKLSLEKRDAQDRTILVGQIPEPELLQESASQPLSFGDVKGRDGVVRQRLAVVTPLVPDHLRRRAERFREPVTRWSEHYRLDRSLVMAIIETESAFNPAARSWANAYGLMQIVPKFAGRETWREIFQVDQVPAPEYLLDPEKNIQHGCCYLYLLQSRHWAGVADGDKKDYMVICSYNCGPHNVKRMVIDKCGGPEQHTVDHWFELLTSYAPKETQDYLRKVTRCWPKWRAS